MKLLLLILFLCSNSIFIKKKDFSGYIFNKEHFVFLDVGNNYERYTPTEEDIIYAEKILKLDLEKINDKFINQTNKMPKINKKLNKYIRQYVGFINDEGEKIIWINFIWKNQFRESEYKRDIIHINDGGSYFWSIKVDFEKEKLYDLQINGSS